MPKSRLRAAARRTLATLQAEPGDGWIDLDRLIGLAEIRTADDDLDTRLGAVLDILIQLEGRDIKTEQSREAAGDFFRLARPNVVTEADQQPTKAEHEIMHPDVPFNEVA